MDQAPTLGLPDLGVGEDRTHAAVDGGEAPGLFPGVRRELIVGDDLAHLARRAAPVDGTVGLGLQLAVLGAGVGDLLEQQDPLGHRGTLGALQQGVEVAVGVARRRAVAADDERAGHAAADLQSGGAVAVRVVPEGPRRMVGRNVVFIFEADAGIDRHQDIVAVAGRADPDAVAVQVGAVEAVRVVDVRLRLIVAVGVGRKLVLQLDADRVARSRFDGRGHEGVAGVDVGAAVAAQPHRIGAPLRRVADEAVGEGHEQVVIAQLAAMRTGGRLRLAQQERAGARRGRSVQDRRIAESLPGRLGAVLRGSGCRHDGWCHAQRQGQKHAD